MGLCFSCCRRRKTGEREPLLPKTLDDPPQNRIDKFVDVVGALNAHKLPSQDQLNRVLQLVLCSDALDPPGYGTLSAGGMQVIEAVKEVVQAVLRIGMEKNDDNLVQDLIYQSERIEQLPVRVDADVAIDVSQEGLQEIKENVAAPPTRIELAQDVTNLAQSVKTIAKLLITSSAFRLILSDILGTAREMVAATASSVSNVASQVQMGAEQVERAARLDDLTISGLKGKAKEAIEDVGDAGVVAGVNLLGMGDMSAQQAKDTVIGRVSEVIQQSHRNSKYRQALTDVLSILRKYSNKLSQSAAAVSDAPGFAPTSVSIIPIVTADEHLATALADAKTLLERAASGRSLDPLLGAIVAAVTDTFSIPGDAGSEVKEYFSTLGGWFDRALSEPAFATSRAGTRELESLYDSGRTLLAADGNSQWAADVRGVIQQTDVFMTALTSDEATIRLVNAVDRLTLHTVRLSRDAVFSGDRTQRKWTQEVIADVLGWFLPRILKSMRAIPMPRVEFQNGMVDVAIDALLLTSSHVGASLLPDHAWVQNWSEVKVDMSGGASGSGVQTSGRLKIHLDGVRVSAHGIGYYFAYKGMVGYDDEGLLSVDVVGETGQGLSVDIDLETLEGDDSPLFRVVDVNVGVPGLTFSIDQSKHWILNKMLLQPLSGPVVRTVLGSVLQQQIRTALESLGKSLSQVVRKANADAGGNGPSVEDYFSAFISEAPGMFSSSSPHEDEEEPEVIEAEEVVDATHVESHTKATVKGIVLTTTVIPDNPDAEPEETVLAIGGGAQLFPDKGGPYGETVKVSAVVTQVAREALDDIQSKAVKVEEGIEGVVDGMVDARRNMDHAEERLERRKEKERVRGGWRSRAFDL